MTKEGPTSAVRSALRRHRPILLFLSGPNGAGKSTFHRLFLRPLGLPFVNADAIALELRETRAVRAEEVDRLAFDRAEELRSGLVVQRTSFCTETVFSDPAGAKLELLRRARRNGFWIVLVFIGLDSPELSLARVVQRVAEGGHDVADDKLFDRYPRTLANLRAAIPLVDEAFVLDNSSDVEPFRLVAIYARGRLSKRGRQTAAWAAGLPDL